MRTRFFLPLAVIVLVAAAIVFAASRRQTALSASTPHSAVNSALTSPAEAGDVMTTSLFRTIAKRENPVVVAITTQSKVKTPDLSQFFGDQDFFRRFFGGVEPPREQVQEALGSGFLISPDGEIVTNNHVVAGADKIRVALFNDQNKTYQANVVGRDPLTDTALIKLVNGPSNLPTASLGNSDNLQPGDWVMAIGNPFQLGHTVTVGVISYTGRPFATTEGRFENMLQTDASINPGNSGGPLIDVHGNVIGVNSAILSNQGGSGGNIGIGFAVPINTVKELLPQLRKGSVERGQLGVQILSAPITQEGAKSLGLAKPEGAIVSSVVPDSPADQAGLRAGDVIVEYQGKAVPDSAHLTQMVVNTPAGTEVPIVVYRDGKPLTLTATIEKLDLDNATGSRTRGNRSAAPGFGLSLGNITPDVASQLNLPSNIHGAVVENVQSFTPASSAGIKRGDIILEINRRPVRSAPEASATLRAIPSGQPTFILLWRQGARVFVELTKE